ncbi:MAG: gliding-motility protein MglA [Deltaproteobacteria bacterium RIFCSPLOWO2_02_FULL_44_10]|nr:MAG: gliding-motility protein MglA [Deltaproteobacteria bacterium RIFCSPHIGHO2_02_FULL_44_16]OGQ45235.1 MAG: gliding-motility protein MglA [Deltaproteobacteria bacterium RIFCSPLOWO2_02_FULL_44_10]
MSFINDKTKEINCKVVYYGPPQCGKSTTLKKIYEQVTTQKKGELISLNQENDRTLYFDFVPLHLGKLNGYTIRLHLYTVPGEIGYQAARSLTSKGVDGAVFIADSSLEKTEANLESLRSLKEVLSQAGDDPEKIPFVFQYNKRDLPRAVPVAELSRLLNKQKAPEFETIATQNKGVFEALTSIGSQVLLDLKQEST